ncbi:MULTISPECIES: beta-ribofuranosylaminobenzene 5'-phosphate synthase family protein [Methylotenera]|uniref:beta-ribofuranosylaminobenzene 5'-phosphate synthase family protein n=1 Tax=Methylotenera TaxID=359407 RepID=UPI000365584E|nr:MULTISPECIES: beta-ribofuranosylaminobenzene 5'-phosphate synthase family protein [Methylotenera]
MNPLNPISPENSEKLQPQEKLYLEKVTVTTTARLHMGFVDLNGSKGRLFGSLGLALNAPITQLTIAKSEKTLIAGKNCNYVVKIVENIKNKLKIDVNFLVDIQQNIPEHAGLGSGTQMALAISAGINALCDLNLTTAQLASLTNRGNRSGVGIGTFEHGGLVLDGGRKIQPESNSQENNSQKNNLQVPPIIARHDFAQDWPILLIMDNDDQGVFGDAELQAFETLKSADFATAQALSHSVLMQALPAIIERDYAQFSEAIHALQLATGNYFSTAQGGHYKSSKVAEVLNYINAQGIICAGQSSWGPTGFAIFESDDAANKILNQLQQQFSKLNQVQFRLVRAKNTGATIQLS